MSDRRRGSFASKAVATATARIARSRAFALPVIAFLVLALGLAWALSRAFPDASSTATAAVHPPPGFSVHENPRTLPEIRFETGEGETITLAHFRGRVVLLNLWATWCAPCRREMPTLDRLQAALGGGDFEVLALSIDRTGLPAVKEFYQELGLERLPIYVDQTGAAQRALNALGLPTTLLIDREGNEVGRLLGPAEWDSPEMVGFIRGYVERQSGAALGRASDEVQLASDAVRPVAPLVWTRAFLPVAEGTTCKAGKETLR
jgi:thiol-disulfide isomerase/thioredoxin